MNIKLLIFYNSTEYDISSCIVDDITLETKRRGSPAKFVFKIVREFANELNFAEGARVSYYVDDYPMFLGYVFSKSRDKEQIITVTAYDQTRYFKNTETYVYENYTATKLIKAICEDFNIVSGEIIDTEYILPKRKEDNQKLWDIILSALDLTMIYTGQMYILYDDFGKLTLKKLDDMLLSLALVSDADTLIDFEYKTDIENSYNRIKLYRDNEETKKRDVWVAEDSLNQLKWGLLQYTEDVSEGYSHEQIVDLVNRLLKSKNKINKTLKVTDIGDVSVRAGCAVNVIINDVGEKINSVMVVSSCKHIFKNNEHTMVLELEGGI